MQKLIDGLVKFRKSDFEAHRDLFKDLKAQQKPHTLFIFYAIYGNSIIG